MGRQMFNNFQKSRAPFCAMVIYEDKNATTPNVLPRFPFFLPLYILSRCQRVWNIPLVTPPTSKPAPAWAFHRVMSHFPSGIHHLQHGVLHGLNVYLSSLVEFAHPPHTLQLKLTLEFQPVQHSSTEHSSSAWPPASPGTPPWLLSKCSQAQ